MSGLARAAGILVLSAAAVSVAAAQPPPRTSDPHFTTGVDLVNVAATVSDALGRFVSGLSEDDFTIYEDDLPQAIAEFGTDRLPVSLGIALDTSGSMAGQKIEEARLALDQFLDELLDRNDEIFLYRFSDHPLLLEGWTRDRAALDGALADIRPDGGTAMYDTVASAVPIAAQGKNRKKALVLISDGNDTSSSTPRTDVRQLIRESEVLVYAVGIDGTGTAAAAPTAPPRIGPYGPPPGGRVPFPFPGGRRIPGFMQLGSGRRTAASGDHVDAAALRELTDDSGGRTEIVRDVRDLYPATASIADELSKQYDLSYVSNGRRDGRWHTIRVEVKNPSYRVRARRGYFAN